MSVDDGCYCLLPPSGRHSSHRVPRRRKRLVRGGLLLLRGAEVALFVATIFAAVALLAHPPAVGRSSVDSSFALALPNSGPNSGAFSVQEVAAKVLPSVVTLKFNDGNRSQLGSGVILTADGLIMTNNHVVAPMSGGRRPPADTEVTLSDGRTAAFDLIATDPRSDIAIGRARDVSGLTPISVGSSAELRVGQPVAAVGSPLGLRGTVTAGIVSALNRLVSPAIDPGGPLSAYYAIQTDAAINPGNSGGALVDMNGALVGINAAEAVLPAAEGAGSTAHGSIGLNYAIPVDHAARIAAELATTGQASHGWLGVQATGDAGVLGAKITGVDAGSPGAAAGLTVGAVVTKVDDQIIDSGATLVAAVQSREPGASVALAFVHSSGLPMTARVTLGTDQGRQ
ncbi:trypsin-like peptidase domain-containing protein [Mycobacterium sp. UM_CSW]|uniref:S1C family serine protease n=1 Tax=Mycobacterium sp. UM_CSW TaxID=1370119 RepID=UPI00082A082E|nr:trypsin-like peptidase domain-containing protein [Mycobacterium sp. UM_CSW]